jgi:hypothetical protein
LLGLADQCLDAWSLTQDTLAKDFSKSLATKVLHTFFVSNCGSITLELAYFPTVGATGAFLWAKTKMIREALKKVGVTLAWTSTDGFQGCFLNPKP